MWGGGERGNLIFQTMTAILWKAWPWGTLLRGLLTGKPVAEDILFSAGRCFRGLFSPLFRGIFRDILVTPLHDG